MKMLVGRSRIHSKPQDNQRLDRLRNERRKLVTRLTKLDTEISRLEPAHPPRRHIASVTLDRWLSELVEGLPELPRLPADFSRSDLYDDHD